MIAVVLAAGFNRRLGVSVLPKPFLPLTDGGPSFVDRHLDLLNQCGVESVRVVVSGAARDRCPPLPRTDTSYVVNPFDTSATGSTLSVLSALRALDRTADTKDEGLLIMDGDIVYESALIQWVVNHCTESRLFTTPVTAGDDEEVRVYGTDAGSPRLIGKGFSSRVTEGLKLLGESLGMIYVDGRDREFLRATTDWLTGWDTEYPAYGFAKEDSEHEETWQYFFTLQRMSTRSVPRHFMFSECDNEADYRMIRTEVYPAILEREMRTTDSSEDDVPPAEGHHRAHA